jgi:hypothetical protein
VAKLSYGAVWIFPNGVWIFHVALESFMSTIPWKIDSEFNYVI